MVREERTIEVTLISATDLKKVKKFGREQKNYVSVYIYPARKQTTGADPYGGVNPIWNTTLKLTCYESDLHPDATSSGEPAASSSSAPSAHEMTLEVYSHGGGIFRTADKLVGTVTVPLEQVASAAQAGGAMPPFEVHHSGEVRGTLNLSVKLGAKRELGDYEDLSAAPLSSYSDQGAASLSYPPASDKVPSTQSSSHNSKGHSSSDGNYYPSTSGYPPSSSTQPGNYNSKGQSDSDGNYYPSASGYPPSSSTQPSSYNSKDQSSFDGKYYPSTSVYPPSSSTQHSNYNSKDQSDFDGNYYPSASGYPPSSSTQPSSYNSKDQSSFDGNYYASASGYPPSTSTQHSSYNSKGQSSSDGNYYPPPSSKQNTSAGKDDDDEVVTGYPVPEYAFAPLGQMPIQRQQQPGSGPGLDTSGHGPYVELSSQGMHHQTRRERKLAKKERKRARKERTRSRRGQDGEHVGPIRVGLLVIQTLVTGLL